MSGWMPPYRVDREFERLTGCERREVEYLRDLSGRHVDPAAPEGFTEVIG
jgi:hypothetical protein